MSADEPHKFPDLQRPGGGGRSYRNNRRECADARAALLDPERCFGFFAPPRRELPPADVARPESPSGQAGEVKRARCADGP